MRVSLTLAFRLLLLVAIVASAVLVVDYRNLGDPAFCGVGSGCLAVRLSSVTQQIGQMLPISLPNLGLFSYVVLFGMSLASRTKTSRLVLAGLSIVGAIVAATLLLLQAMSIKVFCPWCVAVDTSAIAAGIVAVFAARATDSSESIAEDALTGPRARIVWSAVATAAIAIPFLWGEYPVSPPLSADIAAEQVPGKLTLVEFTDFQCPYCRQLHPVIEELRARFPGQLALVRRMMPLAMHPGATPAALLYLCAPEADKERVADALYTVDEEELTRAGCLALATKLGLDHAAIDRALDAPETQAALDRDKAMFARLGQAGLPRTFVGSRVVMGFNPDRLKQTVEREVGGKRPELPPIFMFLTLGGLFAGAAALTLRAARASSTPTAAA